MEELDRATLLGELGQRTALVAELDGGRAFVLVELGSSAAKVTAHLANGQKPSLEDLPLDRSVGAAIAATTSDRPLRLFRADGSTVAAKYGFWRLLLRIIPVVLGVALLLTGIIVLDGGLLGGLVMGAGIGLGLLGVDALQRSRQYRRWALAEASGETTELAALELPAAPDEVDVDDVKAEYGRLLSDVVARIELPALFDPLEPTTKAFTLALLQWDNNDGVADDETRRALAAQVRGTFAAARANAERIGMDHLPADVRDRAETARRAARLAADESAAQPERDAALAKAVAILDELALYYLPTGAQARKAITGAAPLALPGRKS